MQGVDQVTLTGGGPLQGARETQPGGVVAPGFGGNLRNGFHAWPVAPSPGPGLQWRRSETVWKASRLADFWIFYTCQVARVPTYPSDMTD